MIRNPIHLVLLVPAAQIASVNAACRAMDPSGAGAISKPTHAVEGEKDATHALLNVRMAPWRANRLFKRLATEFGIASVPAKFGELTPAEQKAEFTAKVQPKLAAGGATVRLANTRIEAAVKTEDVVAAAGLSPVKVSLDEELETEK